MKYNCESCNYSTDDKGNWSKHKKSKKHFKNSYKENKTTTNNSDCNPKVFRLKSEGIKTKKEYICEHCDEIFSLRSNLSRHLKYCKQNKYNLLLNEYEKYKQTKEFEIKMNNDNMNLKCENDILKEKIKSYENHIETLKNENKFPKASLGLCKNS